MKVVAEHWVKYNDTWYRPGQVYETGEPEPAGAPLQPQTVLEQANKPEEPAKRTRKRKAEE